tara:strand:- start:186 stop:536 length:351 start_codon:yes stop_codon:yes gene_type:complete
VRHDATESKHSPARKIVPVGSVFFCARASVFEPSAITHNTMTLQKNENASIRIDSKNPDHHLFNNNGTWWIHYTSYPTPQTTQRIRRSLKTYCVKEARAKRDAILGDLFACGKEAV